MKTLIFALALLLTPTLTPAQSSRNYDITIRRLDTAEEQLLYEQKRTIGLKKFEIDKQLREIRSERARLAALRGGGYRNSAEEYPNRKKPARPSSYRYRAPEPDWKTVEKPMVVVKGTMEVGGEPAALVSGGQLVKSNQVFATTWQGEARYWRVKTIDTIGATFDRVDENGAPWEEPAPEPAQNAHRPSALKAIIALFE